MHLNSEISLNLLLKRASDMSHKQTRSLRMCVLQAAQNNSCMKHCTRPSLMLISLYSISNCFWNTQRKILIFYQLFHLSKALDLHAALFRSWCLPWVWSDQFKINISSPRILVSKESQEPLLGVRFVFTASNCFTTRVLPLNIGEENTSARSSQTPSGAGWVYKVLMCCIRALRERGATLIFELSVLKD